MRFNIFTVVLASFCIRNAKSENTDGSSSLKQIYDDLAILTRITNAISLQSAALDNSIDVMNVTSELLEINTGNLTEIVLLNTTHALDDFKNLKEASSKAVKDQKKNISVGFAFATYMIIWTKDIANIRMLREISSERYLDLVAHVNQFGSVCHKDVIKSIANFSHAMRAYPMENDDKLSAIISFINASKEVESCYPSIRAYSEKMNDLIAETENIEAIWKAKEVLETFQKSAVERQGNISTYNEFKALFGSAVSLLDKNVITTIRETLQKIKALVRYMSSTKHPKPLVFTAGFSSLEDLTNVSKDLESKWLKAEIAKGKSVDKLKKALIPFNEFAKKVETLKVRWRNFELSTKVNVLPEFGRLARILPDYTRNTIDSFSTVLDLTHSAYSQCWKSVPAFNRTMYSEIDNVHATLDLSIQSVAAIKQWVEDARREINPNFLEVMKAMNSSIDKKSNGTEALKFQIRQIPNYGSLELFSRKFEYLDELHVKLNEAVTSWTGMEKNMTIGLDALITKLDLEARQNCLKGFRQFDSIVSGELTTFMENIFSFSEAPEFNKIHAVASNITILQAQLRDVSNFAFSLKQQYDKDVSANLVLQLKNSSSLSQSLGNGMSVLRQMVDVLRLKDNLREMMEYKNSETFIQVILTSDLPTDVKEFFEGRHSKISSLLDEVNTLDASVRSLRGKDLLTMGSVFEKALKVQGFPSVFEYTYDKWRESGDTYRKQSERLEELKDLDLEFSAHRGDLNAASLSLQSLRQFFDEFFGLKPKLTTNKPTSIVHVVTNPLNIILGCLILIVLLVIGFLVIYGLTKTGRERYTKLWLFYFGKEASFEKRWRYSLFMDRVDVNKNVVCDAVREVNAQNLLVAVKAGAYVNVYNKFGNTGLHVATKRGNYKLVEILIKHGADRSLLNAENKTPEQMIKVMNTDSQGEEEKEEIEKYRKVEMIYNKYRKKKFKKRVPGLFPYKSFHIHMDERTEEKLTVQFMKKFEAVTSSEALPTTTHFIVKTDKDGVLESDDLNVLSWIFNGVIIVKESWMTDCLKNERLIYKDAAYLVDHVKYKEVVYENSILPWTQAMAKGTMPYLYGAQVAVTIKDYSNLFILASIVNNLGGVMLNQFPEKDQYNKGSHPYLHQNLGPIFLIHDGSVDLSMYKNDPDKMFTLFTESEFIIFLLKREINTDKSPNPVPVLTEIDD